MFMKDNKKSPVSLIVSKLGQRDEETQPAPTQDGVEQDASLPLESAAEEIMSAVGQKSPKALVEALKSFMDLCESENYDEPETQE